MQKIPAEITAVEIARTIDHTLLKPEAALAAFDKLCDEARRYHFKAVCVNSSRVRYVAAKLKGSDTAVCSVVGFPLGAMDSASKAFEAATAVACGAVELDMVIAVGDLKSGDLKAVEDDIRAVRKVVRSALLKVIIEICLLTDAEKVTACEICKNTGADFVKTSTGFAGGGATVADVALMRKTVGPDMGVKASGGIKDYGDAVAMLRAGASRLGVSAGVAIVESAPK